MPFDANLTLINGVVLADGTDTAASTTSEDPTSKAKVIDLGASLIGGAGPEGTPPGGLSVALICTTSSGTGNMTLCRVEASDTVDSGYVTIGTFESGTIASTSTPFCYVIRVHTEMRFIRANLTAAAGSWTYVHVVVGSHHLERL